MKEFQNVCYCAGSVMELTKIRRISNYYRTLIEKLHDSGKSPLDIHKTILREDNVSISSQSIKLYLKRRGSDLASGKCRPARRPQPEKRKLQNEHLEFIDRCMDEDNETTAPELQRKLKDNFSIDVCLTTVKKARREIGWKVGTTRHCQIVREQNREKRLRFCLDMLASEEDFDDVVFTDECTVKMESHVRQSFHRVGEKRRLNGVPKHPYQVHVWGGISRRGATKICIFTGRMISDGYQEILKEFYLPFVSTVFEEGKGRLYQDNDPKHTSKSTRKWMDENRVVTVAAPPESPDRNPIEMIWADMKRYIRRVVKPKVKEELVAGIQEYWDSLTPEKCSTYIDHVFHVIPKVIAADGAASGE